MKAMNVLFIVVDDLRPELGCYGKTWVHSPAMDALDRYGECKSVRAEEFWRASCMTIRAIPWKMSMPPVGRILRFSNACPLSSATP